jgi:hypothetical protein
MPLPARPQVVGLYLTHLAERLAVVTLGRRLAAISTMYRLHGHRLDTRYPAPCCAVSAAARTRVQGGQPDRSDPRPWGLMPCMLWSVSAPTDLTLRR